jgi:hypothetical protein
MNCHFQNLALESLSVEECIFINGGEEKERNFYYDVVHGITKAVGYICGAVDQLIEDVGDFFDGIQEGWENTRN